MPDQPADPLHYDMKIPPEKKENKEDHLQNQHNSDQPPPDSSFVRQPATDREKPASSLSSE